MCIGMLFAIVAGFMTYISIDTLLPLSKDYDTAVTVGSRHGKPVIYKVKAGEMAKDGYEFFLSANKVWLTKSVPVKYLEKI